MSDGEEKSFSNTVKPPETPFFFPSSPLLYAVQVVVLESSASICFLCNKNASKDALVLWQRKILLLEEMEEISQNMSCLKINKPI